MNHELLKFLTIVEMGSFTKAAEQLHVSQPALTAAMQKLEKQIGRQLIIRGGGKLSLTNAGKAVYDTARHIRLELDNLNQRMTDKEGGTQEMLRIGMIDSVGDLVFSQSPIINASQLHITVDNSQQLIDDVLLDRIDMAFVTRQLKINSDELRFTRVGREPFWMVVHPELEDEAIQQLRRKVLRNMLSYNERSNTFGLMARTLRGHGVRMQPSTFSTDPNLLHQLCLAGRGPAMLPMRMVLEDIEQGRLIKLNVTFEREIYSVHRAGRYLSQELLNVRQTVQDHLAEEMEKAKEYNS